MLARADVDEQSKAELRDQLSTLDPVRLLKQIRQSQQKLADLSSGCISGDPDNYSPPLDLPEFIQSLSTAWEAGEVRPTHKAKEKSQRTWRTRADPFETDWPMIDYWLSLDSSTTAKEIMQKLVEIDADKYSEKSQLRTLQRRIKDWRIEKANQLTLSAQPAED